MPDIQLRFDKDVLVLSAPIDVTLARQGISVSRDRQYLNLMEPDSITEALRLEVAAGAQCIVAATEDITQARLAHLRMDSDASQLARAALAAANEVRPQHLLVEIGPCGLPLDSSSKASLNENRMQYANAARAFSEGEFDAFLLNGFSSIDDLRCALMGLAQVSDKPVFASVVIGEASVGAISDSSMPHVETEADSSLPAVPFGGEFSLLDNPPAPPAVGIAGKTIEPDRWPEAVAVMVDLGASVVGFETAEPITKAVEYARAAAAATDLPVMAQLKVAERESGARPKNLVPLDEIDEYTPDTLPGAAAKLYGAGVQFMRATGAATPACTGALAATVTGLDVAGR